MQQPTQDRSCKRAWVLRSKWYASQSEKDKLAYQQHLKICPSCRLRIIRCKRLAEQINYTEDQERMLDDGQYQETDD